MEEINIIELLNYYLKKLPYIIIITLLALLIGGLYINKIQVPLYHGTTTIILVQKADGTQATNMTQNELNLNEKLVTTYSQIIKSKRVLDQVIKSLSLQTTTNRLANKISVTSVNETPIIKITVSDENPEEAVILANSLANIFKQEITKIYNLENISIIDKATTEDKPYNINVLKQMVIYGMIGFILSCGIIFVIYYFDNTIKNKKEIETKLNIAVLSEVPVAAKLVAKGKRRKKITLNNVYKELKRKRGLEH